MLILKHEQSYLRKVFFCKIPYLVIEKIANNFRI